MPSSSLCRLRGIPALLACLVFAGPALALDYGPEAELFIINPKSKAIRQKVGTDEKNPLVGHVTGTVKKKTMSVDKMTCEMSDPKVTVQLGLPRGTLARYLMIRPRAEGTMALWGDLELKTKESGAKITTSAFMEVKGYREVLRGKLKIERDKKNKPENFFLVETNTEKKTTTEYELEPRNKRDQDLLVKAGDDATLEVTGMFRGYDENRAVQKAFANQEKSRLLVLIPNSITVKTDEPEKEAAPKDAAKDAPKDAAAKDPKDAKDKEVKEEEAKKETMEEAKEDE